MTANHFYAKNTCLESLHKHSQEAKTSALYTLLGQKCQVTEFGSVYSTF